MTRTTSRSSSESRTLGGWEGRVWIADDFDEPLPDDLQRHFERGGE